MASPQTTTPPNPVQVLSEPIISNPVVQLTAGVTLTTPTSATLITGLTIPITFPTLSKWIMVSVQGKSATVTAAATITVGGYTGATAGALTTLFGDSVVVAPTGGTSVAVNHIFWLPVTAALWGTATNISIAATASTGNFVLNAAATEPTTFVVMAF